MSCLCRYDRNPKICLEIPFAYFVCMVWQSLAQLAGLGNTRRFYCNSNSRGLELQGIGQIISPLEFYCKELIKHSEVQKRIGKLGQNYNSNKRTILSSKPFSLSLVDKKCKKFSFFVLVE